MVSFSKQVVSAGLTVLAIGAEGQTTASAAPAGGRLELVQAAFNAVATGNTNPAYTAEGLLDAINAWDGSQSNKFWTGSDPDTLNLDDKMMLAAFLGNTGHESDNFQAVNEYGCPSSGYESQDECYKGCSSEPCGPGSDTPDWGNYGKYYGRGAMQLSHDYNYNKFSTAVGDADIVSNPQIVAQCAKGSCYVWQSAVWFWSLEASAYISQKPYSFAGTIKSINGYLECPGGTGGTCTGDNCNTTGANDYRVADRIAKFHAAAQALGVSSEDMAAWEANDGSGSNWICPAGAAGSEGYCRPGSPENCGQKCSNEAACGNDPKTSGSSYCWAMKTAPTQQQCDNPPAPTKGYCVKGAKCGSNCATEGDCGFSTNDASCQALTSPPSCGYNSKLRGFFKTAAVAPVAAQADGRLKLVQDAFNAVATSGATDAAYTAEGLLDAINAWDASQSTKFWTGSDPTTLTLQDKVMLAAFLGNTGHESDNFKAVNEYGCPSQGYESQDACYKGCATEPCGPGSATPAWGNYGVYYGRGAIQLTHDYNYKAFASAVGDSNIVSNPKVVAQCAPGSCYVWQSAVWFWSQQAAASISQQPYSFAGTIKAINGYLECPASGCTGGNCNTTGANDPRVADRIAKFHAAAQALGVSSADLATWESNDGSGSNWHCPS